jgi:hypothetical protein
MAMNENRNLFDDDVLLAVLGEALDEVEPLREDFAAAVSSAAFTSRDLNAELAALVSDSLTAGAGVRDDSGERVLSFAAGEVTIDLDLTGDGVIHGVIDPIDDSTATLETAEGPIPLAVDDLGRFTARTTSRRLRVSVARGDQPRVVTVWVTR